MKKIMTAVILLLIAAVSVSCAKDKGGEDDTTGTDKTITTEDVTTAPDTDTDAVTTTAPDSETEPPPSEYPYEYQIDIDEYLPYICTQNNRDFLTVANRYHPVGRDYKPADLIDVASGKQVRQTVKYALDAMTEEMKALNVYDTWPQSCYRSYSYQENLYNRYKNDEKKKYPNLSDAEIEAIVDTYSARPGTSDHQLGMTIDFSPIEYEYEDTKAFKYMKDNAHKFGFILRYPEGKEHITGYSYEPWHWRFVGREAATFIYENNLTLEEYMALVDNTVLEIFP